MVWLKDEDTRCLIVLQAVFDLSRICSCACMGWYASGRVGGFRVWDLGTWSGMRVWELVG